MIPTVGLKSQYETIKDEINTAIQEVLESQQFILGSKVEELENKIANFCNVKHGIAVASGSDALLLALMALDIKEGDEVITTPYTFFATSEAISRLGATPVFVDIDMTYNILPELIEEKITDRTKAILPVHLFGQCANMEPILDIAKRHNLYVIEDAAQAIGAKYKGQPAGSIGDLGCLSFYPTKNLGAYGDGGMVLTNNTEFAEKIKLLRAHGSKTPYYHAIIGINSRFDDLQAAILLVKLNYIVRWNNIRRSIALVYNEAFDANKDIDIPYVGPFNAHVYHQYVIQVADREGLRTGLKEAGIGTAVYYSLPLHLQECYKDLGHKAGDLPISEYAATHSLALPVYPELTWEQQKQIIEAVQILVRGSS